MILRFLILFFLQNSVNCYFQECYVTPCTRDVIIVVDGSKSMQTSTYVSQEISAITKLTYDWTLSDSKVRLALVGAYFGNEFIGADYYTSSSTVEKRLQQFRVSSIQYGLFDGNLNTTIRYLDERFIGSRSYFGTRIGTQKRVVIFTAHSDPTDIASTKNKLAEFESRGFQITLVGIGVTESVYQTTSYHKFIHISFSTLANVPNSVIQNILEDGICFYDADVPTPKPEICTTTQSTTPSTTVTTKKPTGTPALTTPAIPTHPPFPVGDYQNCSCTLPNIYIDIIFVIDVSKGMAKDGLMKVKAEINTLVGQMTLDPTQTQNAQVGIVKYSKHAETVFHPSDYSDEDEFTEDLWDDERLQDVDPYEEVNLKEGLIAAANMLAGMRSGVKKAIVVYASSYDDEGQDDARQLAAEIIASGFSIITVAVATPGMVELILKLGEIASPRMNFTSYRNDLLVDELEDSFCQVNCYCPNGWSQLIMEDRKYGECFFATKLDASWIATKFECPALSKEHTGNGHLVYVNSEHKNNFINEWYMENWNPENKETPNYDIGYSYDTASKTFIWVNGVNNNPYTNWKENNPDLSIGNCVVAKQVSGSDFKWESINCGSFSGRGICQEAACDTDFYCQPHK